MPIPECAILETYMVFAVHTAAVYEAANFYQITTTNQYDNMGPKFTNMSSERSPYHGS